MTSHGVPGGAAAEIGLDAEPNVPYADFVKFCTKLLFGFMAVVAVVVAVGACGGSDGLDTSQAAEPTAVEPAPTDETSGPDTGAAPAAEPTAVAVEPTPQPDPTVQPTATPTPEPIIDPVVFQDDFATSVAPIFADKCASCHNAGGPGAAHWQLDDAADLVETHEWISTVVGSRYMPPWPASDLSVAFHDNRSLRSDEITAISDWSSAGAPLDVDAATAIEATNGVIAIDADVELGPHEPYQGSTDVRDDYRCFIYDPELTQSAWLTAFEFVPDQTEIVHHAIGYRAPAQAMTRARELSAQDDIGGWQCYGGSGVGRGDDLFLGWAPGQLPTEFPEGSGLELEPGDFIILQIHYHFDTADAPEDSSTIRLDWADDDELDPVQFDEFLAPAEIPCATTESGPFCDRRTAIARAYADYGLDGVLADAINQLCGVGPEDFAGMTNGIATSSCTIPVRQYGQIVSVFGHEHEIGSAIRITLNAGRADERVLLDIPDWSFDWQYNYYPVEDIVVRPGDDVLLECEWDRSRRSPDLEPAYVLWADGTNDEMCFATIATRQTNNLGTASGGISSGGQADVDENSVEGSAVEGLEIELPDELLSCMADAGVPIDQPPARDRIDATVDQLFTCAEPDEIGRLLGSLISDNFQGLVNDEGVACISETLATRDGAKDLLTFVLPDSSVDERLPIGELVGDCVPLSDAIAAFGLPLPEESFACIDDVGRDLLVQATVDGELPASQTIFGVINPCLTDG